MNYLLKLTCAIAITATLCTNTVAQDSADLKVNELLEAMDMKGQFMVGIKTMIDIQKQAMGSSENDDIFWNDFYVEAEKSMMEELYPEIVKVYKLHFTIKDMDELIQFYQSSIGKKLLEKNPIIMQESAQLGAQWGQAIGTKIAQKLSEKE